MKYSKESVKYKLGKAKGLTSVGALPPSVPRQAPLLSSLYLTLSFFAAG